MTEKPVSSRMGPYGLILIALFVMAYAIMDKHRDRAIESEIPFADEATLMQLSTDARTPLLVEFWARWCGYCRALDPALTRLARRWSGQLSIVRVDYDAGSAARTQFEVNGLPTFLVFRAGEIIARRQGGMTEDELFAFVHGALERSAPAGAHSRCAPAVAGLAAMPICE